MSKVKSARFGEYIVSQNAEGEIKVVRNNQNYDNVKSGLREISAKIGFKYDPEWNTRKFGRELIDELNKGGDTIAAQAELERIKAETAKAQAEAEQAAKAKAQAEKDAAEAAKAKAEAEKQAAAAAKAMADAEKQAAEKAAQEAEKAAAAKASASGKSSAVKGALPGLFSVSKDKKVRFSMGNLQFNAKKYEFRFAEHQWDMIGEGNKHISYDYDGWIDLFGYGTSGYMGCQPFEHNKDIKDYPAQDIAGTNYDWGVYNPITNGGNKEGLWRTLTKDEWNYLISTRPNAVKLRARGCVNGVNGLIILSDDFYEKRLPLPFDSTPNGFSGNTFSKELWEKMEAAGAVFLPAAGRREGSTYYAGSYGGYWYSTFDYGDYAWYLYFDSGNVTTYGYYRNYGRSVRPVSEL